MKKLITAMFSLLLISATLATSIELQTSIHLDENQGEVNMPTATVEFDTAVSEFDLIIKSNDHMIFSPTFDSDLDHTFAADLKSINFQGEFTGIVEIAGLKIRTYDQKISNARLRLNYTGDAEPDLFTTRYIELDANSRYSDTMKPLPVSNISHVIEDGVITVSRDRSPDLDITKQVLRIKKDGYFMRDNFLTAGETSYSITDLDLENHSYTIEVYSKDTYYASDSVIIEIDCRDTLHVSQDIDLPARYTSTIGNAVLDAITAKIDEKIDDKFDDLDTADQLIAREARNDLIELLEGYIQNTITKTQTSTQMGLILVRLLPLIS